MSYIIINSETIKKRIEELEKTKFEIEIDDYSSFNHISTELRCLKGFI